MLIDLDDFFFQNPLIEPRYGHPTESVPNQYNSQYSSHHRDNYRDNQPYDHERSRYLDGLPTRGQVEEDLRMLGRTDLHSDPYSRQNGMDGLCRGTIFIYYGATVSLS